MRKALLCLALVTVLAITCVPLAMSTAAATSATSSPVSLSSLGTPIGTNLYLENRTRTANVTTTVYPEQTEKWSTTQYFIYYSNAYKVVTTGNGVWNDTDNLYTYWVRLISDPDGSLNSSTPKFSGDEVAVTTWFVFENGSFYWTLMNKTFVWYKFNVATGNWDPMTSTSFSTLLANMTTTYNTLHNHTVIGHTLKVYIGNMLALTSNITTPQTTVRTNYGYFSYWVDMSYLPKIERNPVGYSFDAFTSKDRLIAFVAYNDTGSSSGVMDFGVTETAAGVRSLTSTEAQYVFQAVEAGAVTFLPVVTETQPGYSEALGWGFSISNLTGNMVPVGDSTEFSTTISSVEFYFHFMRNSTAARVKVDEILGQFGTSPTNTAIPSQLDGLSLAIVYYSFFDGLSISKYPATPINAQGSAIDPEGNSTTSSSLSFTSGGAPIVSIGIGGNTYIWNGTETLTANSEMIPWDALQASFTAVGNQSVVQVNFSRDKSVYAACFPTWSGASITHDPYFAVFTYSASSQPGLPTTLIIAGATIGVIAAVAVIAISRRRRAA